MRLRFFRLSKPSRYDYKPIYYQPEKEELEERVRRAEHEAELAKMSGDLRTYVTANKRMRYQQKRAEKSSNIRLVVIFIVLVAISFYLLDDFWAIIINSLF